MCWFLTQKNKKLIMSLTICIFFFFATTLHLNYMKVLMRQKIFVISWWICKRNAWHFCLHGCSAQYIYYATPLTFQFSCTSSQVVGSGTGGWIDGTGIHKSKGSLQLCVGWWASRSLISLYGRWAYVCTFCMAIPMCGMYTCGWIVLTCVYMYTYVAFC